jgi:hypothetical protein
MNIHPGIRVVKSDGSSLEAMCLADVAVEHFDRAVASRKPITRKDAWRLALRDFGQGLYQLAPARKRQSSTRTKVKG